jgi:quercetin dioxygenase-like cupin family protein
MSDRHPPDDVVFQQDDLLTKDMFEGVTIGLAWGEKLMFSLVTFEPSGDIPEHSHPHEQAGVCLEGQFELIVEGESRIVRAGELYIIPGNAKHAARAVGNPCKTLDVFAPPREEYKS